MRAEFVAKLRVCVVLAALLLSGFVGWQIGVQSSVPAAAQVVEVTPTSTYLSSAPIPNAGTMTQVWMRDVPFCVRVWWYDAHGQPVRLCSEYKADTPVPGVNYKIDLPGPAALALVGRGLAGWELQAVPLARPDMLPGGNFVPVSGPTLVTVLVSVTPSPVYPPPPASATMGASVTPGTTATSTPTVANGVTPTPSPSITTTPAPAGTAVAILTLSPAQKRAFTVYCDLGGGPYKMIVWGSYGLTYSVPDEWCKSARTGAQELLRRMAEATPAVVEVRP